MVTCGFGCPVLGGMSFIRRSSFTELFALCFCDKEFHILGTCYTLASLIHNQKKTQLKKVFKWYKIVKYMIIISVS